jgi:plastocyanin
MRKLAGVVVAAAVLTVPAVSALGSTPTKKVNVVDFAFKPKTLTVKKGTKVTWNWTARSGIRHDVSVKRGPVKFHSRKQSKGTFTVTFKKKGTYHLICTIHPTLMKETITVK